MVAAVGIGIAATQNKGDTNAENTATKSTELAPVNQTPTPSATPTSSEETDRVITAEDNKELAALLKAGDYCDPSMAQFAAKYQGQKIEFDGSIANVHGVPAVAAGAVPGKPQGARLPCSAS